MTSYANRFSAANQSIILADYDTGRIACHLDWHRANDADKGIAARHDRHVATLVMRPSEEFARWDAFEGKLHSQAEFARFIEENSVDVLQPDQATLIEISRDLEATSEQSFKAKTRLQNGDRVFVHSEETRVQGEITIPSRITLEIPLYHGEEPTQVEALFRYRATPAGLQLAIQWHRVEYKRQATFREVAHACAEDTGLPLHFGKIA